MRLVIAKFTLGKTVVLYQWAVCGTYVGAASAFHAKIYLEFFKSCYAIVSVGQIKSF